MKVLLLEAGSAISQADFHHTFPYQMEFRGHLPPSLAHRYSGDARNYRIMLDREENPYTTSPGTDYRWTRSRCLGGRTLHWARATDRMANYEFKAASRDGYGVDWPISYEDLALFYDRVETFIGVSGERLGLPQFPDGPFLPPMPLNCAESIFKAAARSLGWPVTHRRLAQLTEQRGVRPPCHYCGNCVNGCDVGAMFSSISSTLPPALKTGNLELRTDCVVARVRMNTEHRAQGVTYIERYTMKTVDVDAAYVILAASTLENTRLLLLSAPGGLANSSGLLGHYMIDQVGGGGVYGFLPRLRGGASRLDDGKAAGITIPNFQNIDGSTQRTDVIRGYVMNATGGQTEYPQFAPFIPGYGSEWKREIRSRYVAQARVWNAGAEMLARKENFVELDPDVRDRWNIPVLKIYFTYCDNDRKLVADFQYRAEELFRKAGGEILHKEVPISPAGFPGSTEPSHLNSEAASPAAPAAGRTGEKGDRGTVDEAKPSFRLSSSIHEAGTARMSGDSQRGVLNQFCRTHDVPNLYVFGGNAFCSTGDKHPTLTMMALTARGCAELLRTAKTGAP